MGESINPFSRFCEACEEIRSTTSKHRKVETLAQYLLSTSLSDLSFVCRLLSGYAFPKGSGKELLIGHSNISDIIREICDISPAELEKTYLRHGDLGLTAEELFSGKSQRPLVKNELSLTRLQQTFAKMASMKGVGSLHERRMELKGLFLDSSPAESKYLSKILTGELRIGLVEGLVVESIAKAFGCSPQETRSANLVLGDIGLTATYAAEGRLSEARIELWHPTNFMLADAMSSARQISEYFNRMLFVEHKYDGVRTQVHKAGSKVKIFSRKLEDVTRSFPEVVEGVGSIDGSFVLDGEVLPFRDGVPLQFLELQQRLRRNELGLEILKRIPVVYFVYDILYYKGETLLKKPLEERRRILELMPLQPPIRLSHLEKLTAEEEIEKAFQQSKELGYEGLVVKDPSSPYEPGRRGRHWVKLKKELDTLDVVIVGAEYGHGKRARVLSDYIFAVRSGDELRVVGKAYSGLTDKEIFGLTERLKEITVRDLGYRRLVKPEIILEVAFDNIQKSRRHNSGYALRFPRIKCIREDKTLQDIDTMEKVEGIYSKQSTNQSP